MREIPLSKSGIKHSGKYFAQVDDEDYELLSKFRWSVRVAKHTCYAERRVGTVKIKMHRAILGIIGEENTFGDHRDRNGLNNQRDNLRAVTKAENNTNRITSGKSQYYGVSWDGDKWRVRINVNGTRKHVGRFDNETVAAKAYNLAAIKYECKFTPINAV